MRSDRGQIAGRSLGGSWVIVGRRVVRRRGQPKLPLTPRLSTLRPAGDGQSQGWATSWPTLISKGLEAIQTLSTKPSSDP